MPIDLEGLLDLQKQLMAKVPHSISEVTARRMVSGLGLIEETLEYLNSTGHKPWRPMPQSEEAQLEEITDMLFFYLELIAMSGFTVDQIGKEYIRKHAVNLERYKRGKKGDYGWDDRGKGEL